MKVSDLLKIKGSDVFAINSHDTMSQVIKSMIEKKVGSLVVIDSDNNPLGIISERDIIHIIGKYDYAQWINSAVNKFMTKNIIIGVPDDDLDYIISLMTLNRFRHVPIIANKKLVGLISIGDVVKSLLKDAKTENRYLSDYISGKYPA